MKNEILSKWVHSGPDLEELYPLAISAFQNENELIQSIEEVHRYLTVDRHSLSKIYQDQALVSAYFLFYFPTHIIKLARYFQRLGPDVLAILKSIHSWIDFGAGPATFTLPLSFFMKENPSFKIELIESSALMRRQAARLLSYFYPNDPSFSFHEYLNLHPSIEKTKDQNRAIFFGHSFNEWPGDIENLLAHSSWKAIILLEPGTKETFQR